jgi:hypothetical protein
MKYGLLVAVLTLGMLTFIKMAFGAVGIFVTLGLLVCIHVVHFLITGRSLS